MTGKMKLFALTLICAVGVFMMTACGGASTGGDGTDPADQASSETSDVTLAPYLFVKGQNLEFYGVEFMIPEGMEVARGKIEDDSVCLYRGGEDEDLMIKVTAVSKPDDGFGNTPDLVSQADAAFIVDKLTESDMTVDFWEQAYLMDGDLVPFIRMGYKRDNGTLGYLMSFVESERRYEDGYPKLYTIYMESKGSTENAENDQNLLIGVVSETMTTWHLDQRRSDKFSDLDTIRGEVITDDETQIEAVKTGNEYLNNTHGYSESLFYEEMGEAGYSNEDTKYALGILNPDWYRQAMIRAEFFARDGVKSELELKELLEGEQFDEDQAEYGAVKALQK